MDHTVRHQIECSSLPILSSKDRGWENIVVEQFQHPAGEGKTYYNDEHSICLSLAPRPVYLLQIKGGKTHTGLYGQGDISVTPAKTSFFARWDSEDRFLQIRIASEFIKTVAKDALEMNPEQVEFIPEFRTRDSQIEAMSMMLLAELQQENLGGRLYIDSLANVLAVHLLRQYSAHQPRFSIYEGGLPKRQLVKVLDYINEYLDRDIKLADLAQLLGMSQFHFSYLFKRSLGIPPYQYLLQQRIERAKQLLKQTDKSIVNIAFACGFNSHSHLTKQFRQLTGMTPKAFRATY
ncbi:MAG: AraC family transcriptional regulator [Pleurocapsa minor HA4230-MV1]|jgi:AraC family transcriptional regulator|nr:AraC family transcriptional regulator [Pleurocapsa minor HA4230-MV1]